MIDKICTLLTNKIRQNVPDIDDERAEIINYGLQNIIGEIPKTFLIIAIAFLLGIGELTLISFLVIFPFRAFSGGFHLKTHIGCILGSSLFFMGNALLSKYIVFNPIILKYIIIVGVWVFGMCMVKLYAPADTANVPILNKKIRKQKQILSYITLTITLIIAAFISNTIVSNMMIFGMLLQSISISRLAYNITNNKYGYEVYN